MRFLPLIALCFLLMTATASQAEPVNSSPQGQADLASLLDTLGKKASDFKTLKTDFTQEKKMAMFKGKLVMKGRIYLQKPNKIAWHVDSPLRYSVLITDKMIRQWDEDTNKVQEISLSKNPIFQNVITQLTIWFSGEYGSLMDENDVRVIKREPFVIEFTPKASNVSRKIIKNITISFRDDQKYLKQIRIQEVNGDVTTLHFTNTLLNAPLNGTHFEVKGRV